MKIVFNGADDESLCENSLVIPTEIIREEKIESIQDVVDYIFKTETRTHKSFFNRDGTVANGTICLLNDVDTELADCSVPIELYDSELVFISTLHGG